MLSVLALSLLIVLLLNVQIVSCFTNNNIYLSSIKNANNHKNDNDKKKTPVLIGKLPPSSSSTSLSSTSSSIIIAKATASTIISTTTAVTSKDIIAKGLGYVLGFGALAVYLPIIINLIKAKSADGYSVETWIYNLIGLTIACLYPYKKGFGVSTYVEILAIAIQSAGILGLICYYQDKFNEYLIGMLAFIASCSFICITKVPISILNWMQVAAIIICNYANIPQIVLTFQTKKATWSWITSAMSMAGNLIRVFTTIQLTKDKLVLSGNALGFLTNLILFAQVFIYKK